MLNLLTKEMDSGLCVVTYHEGSMLLEHMIRNLLVTLGILTNETPLVVAAL